MITDELAMLLDMLGRRGFVIHKFRDDRDGPEVVGATYDWGGLADVLIMYGESDAHAYRALTAQDVDLFAPDHVVWTYHSSAVWTLRAVLTLPQPGHPEAPTAVIKAPPGIGLPKKGRMPVRVRMRPQYSSQG